MIAEPKPRIPTVPGVDALPGGPGSPNPLRLLVIGLVVLAVHVYGWQITKIDLVEFVTGLPNMRHIVLALLQPDLFERTLETVSAEVGVGLGCANPAPRVAAISIGGVTGQLTTTPGCANTGEAITVTGEGYPPQRDGQILLIDSTGYRRNGPTFKIAADGTFAQSFQAPTGVGEYKVRVQSQWPTGAIQPSEALSLAGSKLVETLLLALLGTTASVIFTLPLSFLGARNLMHGSRMADAIYYATRTLFNVLRSIEVLIIAVIMVVVVGIGPFAGVLAIVVHSIGALGKLYSEAIESIDEGPIEAITATGANRLQVIAYAVVPQVIPAFLSFTMYRWDINVRMSTVIGLVGGGGIGYILIQYINLLQWNQAATALWMITIVVMILDFSSAMLRRRFI